MGISRISSPGVARWLAAFGVRRFETQEPSDLEYDPQLVCFEDRRLFPEGVEPGMRFEGLPPGSATQASPIVTRWCSR